MTNVVDGIAKNGWEYSTYSGRHKLTHVFMDGSLTTWTFIQTGGVYTFDHYVDYANGKRGHYTSCPISRAKAEELIERWSRIEEWA